MATKKASSQNVKARVQEKEELSGLNDRLAAYIDRVRSLENQNAKLNVEVSQAKDTRTREVDNIKGMYEAELSESRRLLDDTSKEKALLKLENNKLNGILSDLRPKMEQEQSWNKQMQSKLRCVENSLVEKENLLAVLTNAKLDLENRVKDLEEQLENIEGKLAKDKEELEKEIIARIDAENRYQTLKEETQFNHQVHQSEVNAARTCTETQAGSFSIDVRGGSDDAGALKAKLQELREQFEEEAECGKQELDDAYREKFAEMKDQTERDHAAISKLLEKQGDFKSEVDSLKSDNNVLTTKLEQLQKRIVELDSLRVMDKEEFKGQLGEHDEKSKTIQEKYDDLEEEYQTLLSIKGALDMELAAYNKLLEGEEQRLNIPAPASKSGGSKRKHRKRGRKESMETSVESSATGAVVFAEVDLSGKFVVITNNGTEDEKLGDYFVHRVVDEEEDKGNGFKFPCDFILPSQHSVTLWSESHGMKDNPPNEFVLQGDWVTGVTSLATTIVNTDSEIIAKHVVTMSGQDTGQFKRKTETCLLM